MTHAPAPTRIYPVRKHAPLYVYPCRCGAIFFVLENALNHLAEKAAA